MINFERIDPHIMKEIRDQTLQEIVHTKPETTVIRKKESEERHHAINLWELKKKVKKYNEFFEKHKINIFLKMAEGKELSILVFKRDTDQLIETFNDDQVQELLMKVENLIGLFVDHRI